MEWAYQKLTRFAKELNVEVPKCLKLSIKETTSMVVFNDRRASVANVGTKLPDVGSVTPLGDLPSVDTCTGSSFGETWTLTSSCNAWGCSMTWACQIRVVFLTEIYCQPIPQCWQVESLQ